MTSKLELTWVAKEKPIKIEPRLLIENTSLSNCINDPNTENMLIHGDNLPKRTVMPLNLGFTSLFMGSMSK